jgi:sulfate adenylyltransferase large subunit
MAVALSHPVSVPAGADELSHAMSESQLLRFFTAGSVDDGKSTLIGRLLFEAKGVYEDQVAAVKKSGLNRSSGDFDFSLLTDGLRAEREQGITIDVAYRYFQTARRKFIIADTPGHEQYTRNMATGASTADLAIILIDARKGVLPQSRRHGFISALLGVQHAAVAVNKMDLVDFSESRYQEIQHDFSEFARAAGLRGVVYFPISALDGDNIVERSRRTPWYGGPALLEYLETVQLADREFDGFRFPIQYVIRPTLDFRGYGGRIASGAVRPGERVMALPSRRVTTVRSLPAYEGDLAEAYAPMSATVCLGEEIDLSRGEMLVSPDNPPAAARRFEANLVWMHQTEGVERKLYLLKHTTQVVHADIRAIRHRVDVNSLEHQPAPSLKLNEIALVEMETRRPVFCDPYARNRVTGSFILIDPLSNATVAAGMITQALDDEETASFRRLAEEERTARYGHKAAVAWMPGRADVAHRVERMLFEQGGHGIVLNDPALLVAASAMLASGSAVLYCGPEMPRDAGHLAGLPLADWSQLPADGAQAALTVMAALRQTGGAPEFEI